MKRASQITFGLAILFLAFFLFGITDTGQTVLRGQSPPNATGFELDDIYMGAGFAPWVYGLVPAVLLAATGAVLYGRYRVTRLGDN
jgi:hypothetical protein